MLADTSLLMLYRLVKTDMDRRRRVRVTLTDGTGMAIEESARDVINKMVCPYILAIGRGVRRLDYVKRR